MFACCGKKQKIEIANLRSQPLRQISMNLYEDSWIAHFNFNLDDYKWKCEREATGEEKERQLQKIKEIERIKQEQLQLIQREEEELARLQLELDSLAISYKQKKAMHESVNDQSSKCKKDYLITTIKNELLKKMIQDDKEVMDNLKKYEFAKS